MFLWNLLSLAFAVGFPPEIALTLTRWSFTSKEVFRELPLVGASEDLGEVAIATSLRSAKMSSGGKLLMVMGNFYSSSDSSSSFEASCIAFLESFASSTNSRVTEWGC